MQQAHFRITDNNREVVMKKSETMLSFNHWVSLYLSLSLFLYIYIYIYVDIKTHTHTLWILVFRVETPWDLLGNQCYYIGNFLLQPGVRRGDEKQTFCPCLRLPLPYGRPQLLAFCTSLVLVTFRACGTFFLDHFVGVFNHLKTILSLAKHV